MIICVFYTNLQLPLLFIITCSLFLPYLFTFNLYVCYIRIYVHGIYMCIFYTYICIWYTYIIWHINSCVNYDNQKGRCYYHQITSIILRIWLLLIWRSTSHFEGLYLTGNEINVLKIFVRIWSCQLFCKRLIMSIRPFSYKWKGCKPLFSTLHPYKLNQVYIH